MTNSDGKIYPTFREAYSDRLYNIYTLCTYIIQNILVDFIWKTYLNENQNCKLINYLYWEINFFFLPNMYFGNDIKTQNNQARSSEKAQELCKSDKETILPRFVNVFKIKAQWIYLYLQFVSLHFSMLVTLFPHSHPMCVF